MISIARKSGSDWLAGLFLGLYAVLIALVPSVALRLVFCGLLLAVPLLWWLLRDADRWLVAFFLSAWLLPPLPIAIGNSGPHVALVFAAIGLWIGLLRMSEWQFRIDLLSAAILSLFAVLCLSLVMAAVNSGAEIAAVSSARVLLFGISVYVFFFVRNGPLVNSRGIVRLLFTTAVIAALFACVDFYYQFPAPGGYGAQFVWLDTGVFRRAQGLFYEASTLGNFCAFFLVMIAVAFFESRETRVISIVPLLLGAIVLFGALVLSYSRGSLINLAIALAVLFWMRRRQIRLGRLTVWTGIFVTASAVALIGLFPAFLSAYWLRLWNSAQFFFESPNGVLSGRIQSWTVLGDFILSHPWYAIVGVGYKTLPYSDFIGATAVADNTYLGMLVETGVAGMAAVIIMNAEVLMTAFRAARTYNPFRAFLGTWIFCFWCGEIVQMFSGDLLTYWRVLPAYFCVLALALRE